MCETKESERLVVRSINSLISDMVHFFFNGCNCGRIYGSNGIINLDKLRLIRRRVFTAIDIYRRRTVPNVGLEHLKNYFEFLRLYL